MWARVPVSQGHTIKHQQLGPRLWPWPVWFLSALRHLTPCLDTSWVSQIQTPRTSINLFFRGKPTYIHSELLQMTKTQTRKLLTVIFFFFFLLWGWGVNHLEGKVRKQFNVCVPEDLIIISPAVWCQLQEKSLLQDEQADTSLAVLQRTPTEDAQEPRLRTRSLPQHTAAHSYSFVRMNRFQLRELEEELEFTRKGQWWAEGKCGCWVAANKSPVWDNLMQCMCGLPKSKRFHSGPPTHL